MSKAFLVEQTAHPAETAGSVALYAMTDGGLYARGATTAPLAGGTAGAMVTAISASGGRASSGAVSFANSNAISFGINGSTVTAKTPTVSFYENQGGNPVAFNSAALNSAAAAVSMQRVLVPFLISATRLEYIASLTVNGNTNYSSTMSIGVYEMTGSTATLLSSTFGTMTGNNANYTAHSGIRYRGVDIGTWVLDPGGYIFAFAHSMSNPAGTTGGVSIYGETNFSINPNPGGAAVTDYFAEGIYATATGAFPNSVHLSAVNGSHAAAGAMPYFRLYGSF